MGGALEGNRSMVEGRSSSGFFAWLLLPLLSFCSRGNAKCDEEVEHDNHSIDSQSPIEICRAEPSENNGNLDLTNSEDGNSQVLTDRNFDSCDNDDVINDDVFSTTTNSTQSASVSAITTQTTEDEGSSIDQIKITDLPMLPLLMICSFLKGDGVRNPHIISEGYRELDRFRKTCRTFARVTGSFLENPMNWPRIGSLTVAIKDNVVELVASMEPVASVAFFMHPISKKINFKPTKKRNTTDFVANFNIGTDGMIDELAKLLVFPVGMFEVKLYTGTIETALHLCRNLKFSWLRIDVLKITDDIGAFIIAVSRVQSAKLTIFLISYSSQLSDANGFLQLIDSVAKSTDIRNHVHRRPPLGLPKSFWQQKLSQKKRDGHVVFVGAWNWFTLDRTGHGWTAQIMGQNEDLNRYEFDQVRWFKE